MAPAHFQWLLNTSLIGSRTTILKNFPKLNLTTLHLRAVRMAAAKNGRLKD